MDSSSLQFLQKKYPSHATSDGHRQGDGLLRGRSVADQATGPAGKEREKMRQCCSDTLLHNEKC